MCNGGGGGANTVPLAHVGHLVVGRAGTWRASHRTDKSLRTPCASARVPVSPPQVQREREVAHRQSSNPNGKPCVRDVLIRGAGGLICPPPPPGQTTPQPKKQSPLGRMKF